MEESANIQEVAEPVTETISEETQEVAEPVETTAEQSAETNHAFAEMRRSAQDAERRAKEAEQKLAEFTKAQEQSTQREAALKQAEKIARDNGLSDDEIAELKQEMLDDMDKEEKYNTLQNEKEKVEAELMQFKAERMAKEDLTAIQKIAPETKSLEELGDNFLKLRFAKDDKGEFLLTPEMAYYASKAYEGKLAEQQPKAPQETGFGGETVAEKTYYTKEEVERMSPSEMRQRLDAITESMKRWQ